MNSIHPIFKKRAPTALVALFLLTLALFVASCKRAGTDGNANSGPTAGQTNAVGETSTTPPFATKEPERYQATMLITSSLGEQSNVPGMSGLTTKEMFIARDGEKRRVDTELSPGMKVSYLQTSSGRYMLVPGRKIYAAFDANGESGATASSKNLSSDFSPEKLLNQSAGGARYEKLGAEDLGGRATVKYRVTTSGKTGEAKNVTTESLIWIDETLGMPIKSETTLTGGTTNGVKYSTELRDIRQEVDASLFELPPDYKKVDYKDIFSQVMPAVPGLTDKE
jgi:outer membrane lipoprotein-sorting protein